MNIITIEASESITSFSLDKLVFCHFESNKVKLSFQGEETLTILNFRNSEEARHNHDIILKEWKNIQK